ncbi:Uncharacterised protein [uncultured archaeon]|nr:Uncharacterised protein [uncultured archaeon]
MKKHKHVTKSRVTAKRQAVIAIIIALAVGGALYLTSPKEQNLTGMHDTQYGYGVINFEGAFEFIILIDGVETYNMTNAGETYNVTAIVRINNAPAPGVEIIGEECNGIAPFALIQSIQSNVTNCVYSTVRTGPGGNISYTHVPTGGEPSYGAPFNYTINFYAVVAGVVKGTKTFTVINRAPPPAFPRGNITVNKPNVEGTNERILTVFDRISRSRIGTNTAGINHDIIIYSNGTSVGANVNLSSGQPTGFNITVKNSTTLAGIPNATVELQEVSGLLHWALIQYTATGATTNVSNYILGTTYTDSNGNVLFTIVPTSGFPDIQVEQAIGNYSVTIQATLPNGTAVFTKVFNVDRDLPPPAPVQIVYNKGEVEGFSEKVLVLYDRVTKYIQ